MTKGFLIEDDIDVKDVGDIIKLHILLQCLSKGLKFDVFSYRELSIISELYMFGGINSKQSFNSFFEHCKSLEICIDANSDQTLRNTFSKARSYKILKRPKANNWFVHPEILPQTKISKEQILKLQYSVSNGKISTGNN